MGDALSKGGLAPKPASAPYWRRGSWPLWLFFVGVVFVYTKDVPMLVAGMAEVQIGNQLSALITLVILLALALLGAVIAPGRLTSAHLGLQRPPLVPTLVGTVIALVALYLPVYVGTQTGTSGQDTSGLLGQGVANGVLLVLGIAVVGPVAEEFMYRALLFRSGFDGLRRWLPEKVAGGIAMVASSFVFMVVHVGAQPMHMLAYFLFAMVLSGLYWYTGSLYATLVPHLLSNCYAAVVIAVQGNAHPVVLAVAVASPLLGLLLAFVIGKVFRSNTRHV